MRRLALHDLRRRPGARAATARGGFTLLELMTSLAIGTMIVTATAAIFTTTLDGWRRGGAQYERWQAAEKVGDLIERHLRGAISPTLDSQAVFVGQDLSLDDAHPGHRLTLISSAPGRFPRNLPVGDACEVAFELDPSLDGGMTMRIQCPPDDKPDEGGWIVALSPLIRGFRVIYFDGTQWVAEWKSNGLPKAVEFSLLIDRDADPETLQARAAQQASAAEGAGAEGATTPDAEAAGPKLPGAGPIVYSRLVWLPAAEAEEHLQNAGADQGGSASGAGQGQGQGAGGQNGGGQGDGQGGGSNAGGSGNGSGGGEGAR